MSTCWIWEDGSQFISNTHLWNNLNIYSHYLYQNEVLLWQNLDHISFLQSLLDTKYISNKTNQQINTVVNRVKTAIHNEYYPVYRSEGGQRLVKGPGESYCCHWVALVSAKKCLQSQKGSASKSYVTPPRLVTLVIQCSWVTMAKGKLPAPLNIWYPWLGEGHPDTKSLVLQVGGWAWGRSPHPVKARWLRKPEIDVKATLLSVPITTKERDQRPAVLQETTPSSWWTAVGGM